MIQFTDTAKHRKVPFEPMNNQAITIWACGPTVYDVPHLGNARSAVIADVVFRVLRNQYGENAVIYARNYTDIDDKIITRANGEGIPIDELTDRTIAQYENAMAELNVLDPSYKPRATETIPEMVSMIEKLIDMGVAYIADGHVLFRVDSAITITKLVPEVERIAGHRVAVADYKEDARDFVLWKPAKDGEPFWNGPFGLIGRCGWHLECSAMIDKRFGDTIDIHMGGNDLIFPHHTCEIMQSETVNSAPLARYWLHNGMLTVNGQKMAKSAGNFITVPEALQRAPGEAVRYLLLSGHYRQPLDFTWDKLSEAKKALDRLYRALQIVWETTSPPYPFERHLPLNDDLNTPVALAKLHGLVDRVFNGKKVTREAFLHAGDLLGILQHSPEEWFQNGVDVIEVERLISLRDTARRQKDFATSDVIREQLRDLGVSVEDTADGTSWHKL